MSKFTTKRKSFFSIILSAILCTSVLLGIGTVKAEAAAVRVSSVKLNATSKTIEKGKSFKLSETVSPKNASNKAVTWKSSNTKIVTVDSKGNVKGVSAGTTTITVTTKDKGKKATCKVTVKNPIRVSSVKLNATSKTIEKGKSFKLSETVSPSNASNKAVTWKSNNTKIATVDSKGNVKGVSAGTVTITVTTKDGSKTATCKITVKNPTIYKQTSTVGDIKKSNAFKTYKNFFNKVNFTSNKNFIIPGLDTYMVPQGMCDIGDYVLISAYDKKGVKNSIIHVIKKSTGKLEKSLYINNKEHAGGLAYDGTNVWVANSTKSTLTKISASTIISSKTKDGSTLPGTNISIRNEKGNKVTASFASFNNNRLWVGTFDKDNNSKVYGYSIGSSKLTLTHVINIPKKIQGITFDKNGRVILSQSYGRNSHSYILTYDKPSYSTSNNIKYGKLGKQVSSLTAPPASQNIFIGEDNLLYVLFESASHYYYKGAGDNKAKTPVDRVCPIKIY